MFEKISEIEKEVMAMFASLDTPPTAVESAATSSGCSWFVDGLMVEARWDGSVQLCYKALHSGWKDSLQEAIDLEYIVLVGSYDGIAAVLNDYAVDNAASILREVETYIGHLRRLKAWSETSRKTRDGFHLNR